MVSEGKGRLFRRTDGKYLVYLPVYLAEDSMFPFQGSNSISVHVSFSVGGAKELKLRKWTKEDEEKLLESKGKLSD